MVERSGTVLDHTYGALAHPLRRDMLEILRAGPRRVTDLAAPFDISLAAASKHMRVLESADLVTREIIGREHSLSLRVAPLLAARSWIDTYQAFWEDRLAALDTHLRGQS